MAQRVRIPHRGSCDPSSATQLPILAALYARFPTLYCVYYTRKMGKCKYRSGKNNWVSKCTLARQRLKAPLRKESCHFCGRNAKMTEGSLKQDYNERKNTICFTTPPSRLYVVPPPLAQGRLWCGAKSANIP